MRKTLKIKVASGSSPGTVNLTITEQSHRGSLFGDNGSDTFTASNGLRILSKCHPEVRPGSNEFFVRGTTNCGEDSVLQTSPEFAAKVLDAAAEYEACDFDEVASTKATPKEVVKEAAKSRVFPVFVLPSPDTRNTYAYYQWTDEYNGFAVYKNGMRAPSPIVAIQLTGWLCSHKDQRVLTESEAADRIDLEYPVYIIPPDRPADKHIAYIAYSVWRDDTNYTSVPKDRTAPSKDGYCPLRDYLRMWLAHPGTQIVTKAEAEARRNPLPVAPPPSDGLLPKPTDEWLKEHNVILVVDTPRRPRPDELFVSDGGASVIPFTAADEGCYNSHGGLRWIVKTAEKEEEEEDTWPKYVKNHPGNAAVYFIWQKNGMCKGIGADGKVTHDFGPRDLESWLKSWSSRGAKILTKTEAEALVAPKAAQAPKATKPILNLQYESKEKRWTTLEQSKDFPDTKSNGMRFVQAAVFQVMCDAVYLTPNAAPGTVAERGTSPTPALISKVFGGLCELNR